MFEKMLALPANEGMKEELDEILESGNLALLQYHREEKRYMHERNFTCNLGVQTCVGFSSTQFLRKRLVCPPEMLFSRFSGAWSPTWEKQNC